MFLLHIIQSFKFKYLIWFFFLKICAAQLSSSNTKAEIDLIYTNLRSPLCDLKIVFVTPEKIASSIDFEQILCKLYKNNKISRFASVNGDMTFVPITPNCKNWRRLRQCVMIYWYNRKLKCVENGLCAASIAQILDILLSQK